MKYFGKIQDNKDLVTKEYVDTGLSGKLGTSGDGSDVTAAFTAASSRTNISTGEKLTVIFGKIAKWFVDLGAAAFRGVDAAPTAGSTNLVESGGVKSALDNKADQTDLASIHATGSTNTTGAAIPAGIYFYLDDVLVKAKTDIAINATFTSGTNYETVTAGGLNDLVTPKLVYSNASNTIFVVRCGNVATICFEGYSGSSPAFTLPSNALPSTITAAFRGTVCDANATTTWRCLVESGSGDVKIVNFSSSYTCYGQLVYIIR